TALTFDLPTTIRQPAAFKEVNRIFNRIPGTIGCTYSPQTYISAIVGTVIPRAIPGMIVTLTFQQKIDSTVYCGGKSMRIVHRQGINQICNYLDIRTRTPGFIYPNGLELLFFILILRRNDP